MDHKNLNSRTRGLLFLNRKLRQKQSIFIFPNGSLITSIKERFSPSISFLSFKHEATVIPWKIRYYGEEINQSLNYKPFRLIFSRLLGPKIIWAKNLLIISYTDQLCYFQQHMKQSLLQSKHQR